MAFLLTFSYFLLCDFNYNYDDDYYTDLINSDPNPSTYRDISIADLKRDILKQPSVLEYVLIFWVLTIFIEEIRQVSRLEISKVIQV